MIKAPWRALSAVALLAAIACGDDDGTEPEGSISVSAAPSTLTLQQGTSGTVTVTLTRGGGFSEAVTVSVEGVPAGVTASVSPSSLSGTTTQAVVTVNVASTVAAGSYPITVRASAAGIGAATAQYTLVVTAAPTANYALSATAASVAQGGSGTSTISIQRTNFTGAVALTLESPPAGITGTFNPASATGDNSTLTINVAGTVTPGTYTLNVKGSATGPGDKTTTVALTVTAPANYTLSATPATLPINAGGNAQTTVNIARTNFTGTVNLALDAPPAGITATFNPAAATGTTSTATINVAGTVVPNTYNVTIKGTATGIADKTTTVAVTVSAAAAGFTLTASPNTLPIAPGANSTSTITIARTNFTTDVALSLVSPPAGITGTFTPATLTGATLTSSLQLNVAGTVTPGTYPITVQGVGGAVTQTATITVTVAAAGSFTLTANPTTLPIAPGANATSTITIARTNFTTDVALSLVSPPAGITGTFTPATLTGTTLTSSLQLNVAGTVTPGTYPITVQGVGGTVTQTATVTVTVAAAAGSVTLAMQPTTLTIQQGSSSSATLNLTRTNFTGNVTPSYTGNPAGLTLTFSPNPITGNSAQVTVNVGASTPVGTHTLTITGAAGAAGNPTTTLGVTVTASAGGQNIVWEFCNADGVPLKFWRQSGGTWAEVSPTVVGSVTRFSFTVAGTQGGIAYTTQASGANVRSSLGTVAADASLRRFGRPVRQKLMDARARLTNQTGAQTTTFFDTFVMFALTSELASRQATCGIPNPPAKVNKAFTVSGMAAGEVGLLSYGDDAESLAPATANYSLSVTPGTYDWLATFGTQGGPPLFFPTFTHYRIGRGETAPGGTVAINRTGATAFTTVPYTITGAAAGSINLNIQVLTGANGSIGSLTFFDLTNSGNLLFLAPGDRLSTDMNIFLHLNGEGANAEIQRGSVRFLGPNPPASTAFALPATVPLFTVAAVNGAPVPTWSATGQIPTDFQTANAQVEASFSGAGGSTLYTIAATRGWLTANNMSTSYTLAGPTLPGFLAQWAPAAPLVDAQVLMASNFNQTAGTAGSVVNISSRLIVP